MCRLFKRKKEYTFGNTFPDADIFNIEAAEEINKLRETPLKLVDHKLIGYLARTHKHLDHSGFGIRRQLTIDNTKFNHVGECVAFGYEDATKMVNALRNSPSHHEVLTGNYTHLVIGQNDKIRTLIFLR